MAKNDKTKKVLQWAVIVILGVYTFMTVKQCKDGRAKQEDLQAKANMATGAVAHADSVDAKNKTLVRKNDMLRLDLADAKDSIAMLKDSVVVLNVKNDSLKHANDSIVAELDDCKASKQPAKKTPAKKTPTVVKKDTLKPMPRVEKPCEPIIIEQKPECENSGSTTINVNTPYNTINISNGGIINNFYGDTAKVEAVYKEVAKYQRKIIMGHAVSNESVRCK